MSASAKAMRTPIARKKTIPVKRRAVRKPAPRLLPTTNRAIEEIAIPSTPIPTRAPPETNAPAMTATRTARLPTSNRVPGIIGGRWPSASSKSAVASAIA
jgi:hypothetical protein